MKLDLTQGKWLNSATVCSLTASQLALTTEPQTDLWQRTYYGFRNESAPALLFELSENFTLTCKLRFNYKQQFDQCGLIIFIDHENWFKASIEYETAEFSRLGSVVTNLGYSDWATTDIAGTNTIWYRLSRRGPDFLIESSVDGKHFTQMRIFHMHMLGETTSEMGKAKLPMPAANAVNVGLYACSPGESSFEAVFSNFQIQDCIWQAHT